MTTPPPSDRPDPSDAEVMAGVAPPYDERWAALAAMPGWRDRAWDAATIDELVEHLGALGLVVPFDWNRWYDADRYPGGRGLAAASPADAVRLITAYVRSDRFTDGALAGALRDGSIEVALARVRSRRP